MHRLSNFLEMPAHCYPFHHQQTWVLPSWSLPNLLRVTPTPHFWLFSPKPTPCCFLHTYCHLCILTSPPAYNILSYHQQTSVAHLIDPASRDRLSLYPIQSPGRGRRIKCSSERHICLQEQISDKQDTR